MKNLDNIVEHLLFHKAMISEEDSGRFNKYLEMVNNLKNGTHLAIKDPFDREISIVFELVLEQQFNAWDIDLIKFSALYLKKIKKEKEVDLVTSGRIVLMAWTILKLQSEEVLERETKREEETFDWGDIDSFYLENYDYTRAVMQGNIPIEEKIRRKGDRKVTLMELVDAFEEAKKQAELRKILEEERIKNYFERKEDAKASIQQKVHKEDLEEDIKITYSRICQFNGGAIPLTNICGKDICGANHEEYIRSIISILYLSKFQKIKIWQKNFPYGEIFIKNLNGGTEEFSLKEKEELKIVQERI